MKLAKLFAISTLTSALIGCGGGGGGGGGDTWVNPNGTLANTSLTRIGIASDDTIVNLASEKQSVSVLSRGIKSILNAIVGSNAYADGSYTPADLRVSKIFQDGDLFSIDTTISYFDVDENGAEIEVEVDCVHNNPEIHIQSIRQIGEDGQLLFVEAQYPYVVNNDCSLRYQLGSFIVNSDGEAFRITMSNSRPYEFVLPARDAMRNAGAHPILFNFGGGKSASTYQNPHLEKLSFKNSKELELSDLTPLSFKASKSIAHDGENFIFAANGNLYLMNETDPGFTQVHTRMPFLSDEAEFLVTETRTKEREDGRSGDEYGVLMVVDPNTAELSEWEYQYDIPSGFSVVSKMDVQYRFGKKLVTNAYFWDYETDRYVCFLPEKDTVGSCLTRASANYTNNYVYGESGGVFFKYDLDDEVMIAVVDFDELGDEFLFNRVKSITPDRVIIDAYELDTSDYVFLEGNLNDGTIKRLGTLKQGNRKVTSFVALEPQG